MVFARVEICVFGHGEGHQQAQPFARDEIRFNRRLRRFSPELELLQTLEGPAYGFLGPRYLDIDDFGRLVVADQDAHRVLLIEPLSGEVIGVIGDGTPGMGPGLFDDPEGVAVVGNAYFFADSDNNRIVKYVVVLN